MSELHIVPDLETLGHTATAPILSIGAAAVTSVGPTPTEVTQCFYRCIRPSDWLKNGAQPSASTLRWWATNTTKDARMEAFTPTNMIVPLKQALFEFNLWITSFGIPRDNINVWGNGASFDNAILSWHMAQFDMEPSWPFWGDRCLRTLRGLYPEIKKPPFEGIPHHAMWDALNQAKHLSKLLEHHNANN